MVGYELLQEVEVRTEDDMMRLILSQRPKKIYREHFAFKPFHAANSWSGHQRLELYHMVGNVRKLFYVKVRDYEKHKEIGQVTTRSQMMKLAVVLFRELIGESYMPLRNEIISGFMELYFKPTRKSKSGKRYIHREVVHDCLRDGTTYRAEVARRYGIDALRAGNILKQLCDAGILKLGKKTGNVVSYVLAIDKEEVLSFVYSTIGILKLRKGSVEVESNQSLQ